MNERMTVDVKSVAAIIRKQKKATSFSKKIQMVRWQVVDETAKALANHMKREDKKLAEIKAQIMRDNGHNDMFSEHIDFDKKQFLELCGVKIIKP